MLFVVSLFIDYNYYKLPLAYSLRLSYNELFKKQYRFYINGGFAKNCGYFVCSVNFVLREVLKYFLWNCKIEHWPLLFVIFLKISILCKILSKLLVMLFIYVIC